MALIVPFAAAGVTLVVFLSALRLTVADGRINSVILYANIVQANKRLFFPTHQTNILTVFVAWLNLDLGFETCFYDGMTAFTQTWLQFIFPVYVWFLISLIILASRYSITISKLIGHNPIAVLATLLLMSYTKILKTIIEVYSSTVLNYPTNKTMPVWLKDSNVPYLHSSHLVLTVVTTFVLIFFFLPYTLLLLLGQKLYCLFGRRHFSWLNRFKPILDAYYAPYEGNTRFWTGFLLLVRCVLYVVFSFSGSKQSLLAVVLTFTIIAMVTWFPVRIYKSKLDNIQEASLYLNLVVLSATALADVRKPSLVYSLLAIVFVILNWIVVHHFFALYVAKSAAWLQITAKVSLTFKRASKTAAGGAEEDLALDMNTAGGASNVSSNAITKTEIDLREPLLEK